MVQGDLVACFAIHFHLNPSYHVLAEVNNVFPLRSCDRFYRLKGLMLSDRFVVRGDETGVIHFNNPDTLPPCVGKSGCCPTAFFLSRINSLAIVNLSSNDAARRGLP